MGACVLVGLILGSGVRSLAGRLRAESISQRCAGEVFPCRPGPWGELACTRIVTEPPDGFVPTEWHLQPARWFFKGYSRRRVEELFRSAGLTPTQQRTMSAAPWEESAQGVTVAPDRDLVLNLGPDARARIYSVLGAYPENTVQYRPFRYPASEVADWFDGAGLRPGTVATVQRLLYRGASPWRSPTRTRWFRFWTAWTSSSAC